VLAGGLAGARRQMSAAQPMGCSPTGQARSATDFFVNMLDYGHGVDATSEAADSL